MRSLLFWLNRSHSRDAPSASCPECESRTAGHHHQSASTRRLQAESDHHCERFEKWSAVQPLQVQLVHENPHFVFQCQCEQRRPQMADCWASQQQLCHSRGWHFVQRPGHLQMRAKRRPLNCCFVLTFQSMVIPMCVSFIEFP